MTPIVAQGTDIDTFDAIIGIDGEPRLVTEVYEVEFSPAGVTMTQVLAVLLRRRCASMDARVPGPVPTTARMAQDFAQSAIIAEDAGVEASLEDRLVSTYQRVNQHQGLPSMFFDFATTFFSRHPSYSRIVLPILACNVRESMAGQFRDVQRVFKHPQVLLVLHGDARSLEIVQRVRT